VAEQKAREESEEHFITLLEATCAKIESSYITSIDD
jgi:hypothetical protein